MSFDGDCSDQLHPGFVFEKGPALRGCFICVTYATPKFVSVAEQSLVEELWRRL